MAPRKGKSFRTKAQRLATPTPQTEKAGVTALPPTPKVVPPTHTHVPAKIQTDNSISTSEHMEPLKKPKGIGRGWEAWKIFWAFFGPILTATTFYFNFTPSISIGLGLTIDPNVMYSTQIIVSNNGRIPVYNLSFVCGYGANGGDIKAGPHGYSLGAGDVSPMPILAAGDVTSKSCAIIGEIEGNTKLRFSVYYDWPWIGKRSERFMVFDVKKGPNGFSLVPSSRPWAPIFLWP